jgi:Flp pilus assembly protein TadG
MSKRSRAQSFVEFALVLPVLLIILLGVVELTLFIGTYINLLDLTREAARFASNRDPFSIVQPTAADRVCAPVSPTKKFDFFYDTSCIFSPLKGSASCNSAFCDGFNSTIQLKSNEDDILIYAYTETDISNGTHTGQPRITFNEKCNASDTGGCPWVWSNNKTFDTTHTNNWQRNCNRLTAPDTTKTHSFNAEILQSYLSSGAQTEKGFVVVEIVYCYHQALNVPILSAFLPDPMVIDTYSIMPLPAAQPTLVP